MSSYQIWIDSTDSYDRAYQLDIAFLTVEEVLEWIRFFGTSLTVCR